MSLYLDASILAATLIEEPSSALAVAWVGALPEQPAVSDLVRGEVASAVYRSVRTGRQTLSDAEARLAHFDQWCADVCDIVSSIPVDMRVAVNHVRRFDLALRMPDALHISACARLGLTLATFDRRLLRAAVALGVAAVRPS